MAAFNKVILAGNLVATPELKQTPSGVMVTNFRIAVARPYKKEGQQETDFISVIAWRSTAEFVTKYFAKGRGILLCGRLQQRSWTDNDGNKHYTMDVVADEVSFVDKKPEGQAVAKTEGEASLSIADADFVEVGSEEELPF